MQPLVSAPLQLFLGKLGLGRDGLEELRESGWHGEPSAGFLAAAAP